MSPVSFIDPARLLGIPIMQILFGCVPGARPTQETNLDFAQSWSVKKRVQFAGKFGAGLGSARQDFSHLSPVGSPGSSGDWRESLFLLTHFNLSFGQGCSK